MAEIAILDPVLSPPDELMSLLAFLPWCRVDKKYAIDGIAVFPYKRHEPMENVDEIGHCKINTILGTYKDITGKPVRNAALVGYLSKSLTRDLNDDEINTVKDSVTLACFCGLAKREYFNQLGDYCNSDCFTLYFQRFDKGHFIALTPRRLELQPLSSWEIEDISITVPVNCHLIEQVTLDESLLNALVGYRNKTGGDEWGLWQNAISCFNQANTDNDSIRYQVEWVLLCSAFEHILHAKPEAKDVAAKFASIIVPADTRLAIHSNRRSDKWGSNNQPLRYEWMREFYRIRGDFAHGKLNTQQPAMWSPREHIVLASIVFPLVVKCFLNNNGLYKLTKADSSQINAFEKLADTEAFLKPPPDQMNSTDSWWNKLCKEAKGNLMRKEMVKELRKIRARGLKEDL